MSNCTLFLGNYTYPVVLISYSLFLYFTKHYIKNKWYILGNAMLLLGGMLNYIERLTNGCVYDYINFFGLFMFNINDLLLTLGVIVLFIVILRKPL